MLLAQMQQRLNYWGGVIAIVLIHLGYHRSKKAATSVKKFRWAAITFTIAAVAILAAIPWWRPLLRLF